MFMKDMKKRQNNWRIVKRDNEIREQRRMSIIRMDIEHQTTDNAYTENEHGLIIERLNDDNLSPVDRDARAYFNKSCKIPLSESNLKETNNEFNRRQYQILQVLKSKNKKENKKYE